eukprot:TRINITY_DN3859_c0_g1_i4.p1 TRINITY_DN3859_c0_g1~~TRINITY_DN3859_c0_g1_i4.p1  ORF type:complete len:195 (-),score=38.70 TRINITY_DN3859_c0_g1_i4:4-588(-)
MYADILKEDKTEIFPTPIEEAPVDVTIVNTGSDESKEDKTEIISGVDKLLKFPQFFCDEEAIIKARKEVFVEGENRAWMLLGYEGSTITVQATGTGIVSEILPYIQPDEVQYMLVRLPAKSQESNTTTIRDVMITWTGPKVKIFDRSRKQAHLVEVTRLLQPLHASLTATSLERFAEDYISLRSHPLSGSHVID